MNHLTQDCSLKTAAETLKASAGLELPDGWWNWPNIIEAHKLLSREFLEGLPDYPRGKFQGRGVVICAGGTRLFTNGWVCLRILRHVGCTLPVEFWHLPNEIDPYMAALVAPYGVECIDAGVVADQIEQRPRIMGGWELKAFALLHCRFREVLLLDADNVALVDPDFLFQTPEFQGCGSIFWPDYGHMEESRPMWEAAEVAYRDESEIESGQIVLDKARCWRALNLAMHYNEHSDFYYKHIHGDKCTFQFAWHRTGTAYAMPPFGIHSLQATMCQHDFDGRRIFQHRNMDKWELDGRNLHVRDFQLEDVCRSFLRELATRWPGQPFRQNGGEPEAAEMSGTLTGAVFDYHRVGYDRRILQFVANGAIGDGADECERYWSLRFRDDRYLLTLVGGDGVTCHLVLDADGVFRGNWLHHERMPIELSPCDESMRAAISAMLLGQRGVEDMQSARDAVAHCGKEPAER